MKKTNATVRDTKLRIHKHTLRPLDPVDLGPIAGGFKTRTSCGEVRRCCLIC